MLASINVKINTAFWVGGDLLKGSSARRGFKPLASVLYQSVHLIM